MFIVLQLLILFQIMYFLFNNQDVNKKNVSQSQQQQRQQLINQYCKERYCHCMYHQVIPYVVFILPLRFLNDIYNRII